MTEPIVEQQAEATATEAQPKAKTFRERFLELYADHGHGYKDYKSFCADFNLNYQYFLEVRKTHRTFRRETTQIERGWRIPNEKRVAKDDEKARAEAQEARDFARHAVARWAHLNPPWKAIFLETYRKSKERIASAERCSKVWSEVEKALEADDAFMAGFLEVKREIDILVEDAFVKSAAVGKNMSGSMRYLETHDPRYAKKSAAPNPRTGNGGVVALPPEAFSPAARSDARALYRELFAQHRQSGHVVESTPMPVPVGVIQDDDFESESADVL